MPWLVVVLFLLAYEAWAIRSGRKTLSRMMWEMTAAFPALPALVGFAIGFLFSHFWWGGALICYSPPISGGQ